MSRALINASHFINALDGFLKFIIEYVMDPRINLLTIIVSIADFKA